MSPPAKSSFLYSRSIVVAVLIAGVLGSFWAYTAAQQSEREKVAAEFVHRVTLRHALLREVLGHYEDALFGLSALFTLPLRVTPEEFIHAAQGLEQRLGGVQAFEWVPWVPHDQRAAWEARQPPRAPGQPFEFIDRDAEGRPRAAGVRRDYYPILYVYPVRGNEAALGYDLQAGPTRDTLEQARASRQMTVTPQIRLIQETGGQSGIVLVLPVFRPAAAGAGTPEGPAPPGEAFIGFLQCVFRVQDFFASAYNRLPDTTSELLVIDFAEPDPARRVLYRPAAKTAVDGPSAEQEFRQDLHREFRLPFGQRDWRVIFRPEAGWRRSQSTATPLLRGTGGLVLSGLLAGLLHLVGRRAATVRQQVEEQTAELKESRHQLANMLHALPGMTYRCKYDEQLTVLFLSGGTRELTGWTAEEFLSGAVHFRDCIHPADLERVREATRKALENQSDVEVEYRVRTKAGEEKWVLSRGRGVYRSDGGLSVFEGLAIDITAQKKAETVRLERERKLLDEQKFESLGVLAGGIAHDFNNLLSSILGNAGLARLTLSPDDVVDAPLRAIESASLRAAELCRQMLAYAGKGRFAIEPINLTLLSEELLPLLKGSMGAEVTLKLDLTRDLPPVLADTAQIRQIVMNLVLNAADATPGGGVIGLSTGVVELGQPELAQCVAGSDLPPGQYVYLDVRDAGAGMAPHVVAKIFDPFFTTKFAGRGLGLAAVLGIVRGHRGALRVESAPGQGSSFRLFLPPVPVGAASAKPPSAETAEPWPRTGQLLVIDDEEQVRLMLVAMLRMSGYAATAAADGEAGLALFRERPDHFQVVVLDLLMPGMDGEQTFHALREINPEVRVLIVSGYSEGDILGRLGGGPALRFLAKPFSRAALESKLHDLIG